MKNDTVSMAYWLFCFLLFASLRIPSLLAQYASPADNLLYDAAGISSIYILCDENQFQELLAGQENETEIPATFIFINGPVNDTVANATLGLRGNSSLLSAKKSFKISFNSQIAGQKYRGVEKINLNGEHNDPSLLRAKITWEILKKMEVPAPRATHTLLYINGTFRGVYLNVEHIDEAYVYSRFRNRDGELYKCTYPASLTTPVPTPSQMIDAGYETILDGTVGYTHLANLINILNASNLPDYKCMLEEELDVELYLKSLAVEVMAGHWDSPIYNTNNFYLYYHTLAQRFIYSSYDVDNTFGVDWFGIDWSSRPIYAWPGNAQNAPLYSKILSVPEWRNKYSYYISLLIEIFNDPAFLQQIQEMHNSLAPYIAIDGFYPLDYGYDMAAYEASLTDGAGGHVWQGIFEYMQMRAATAQSQLQLNSIPPAMIPHFILPPLADSPYRIATRVWDDGISPVSVQAAVSLDGNAPVLVPLYDDGVHFDGLAGDHLFANDYDIGYGEELSLEVLATDSENNTSHLFCEERSLSVSARGALRINEFYAGGAPGLTDEYGEEEDYIEIYNGGSEGIFLGNIFLTDNAYWIRKFRLPDVVLQPGNFALIWCDEDAGQGPWHSNFKLNGASEFIGLFTPEGDAWKAVDYVSYEIMTAGQNYGLTADGTGQIVSLDFYSPGYSNMATGYSESADSALEERIWPQPAGQHFFMSSGTATGDVLYYEILDLLGRSVAILQAEKRGGSVWEMTRPAALYGLYFLRPLWGEGSERKAYRIYFK